MIGFRASLPKIRVATASGDAFIGVDALPGVEVGVLIVGGEGRERRTGSVQRTQNGGSPSFHDFFPSDCDHLMFRRGNQETAPAVMKRDHCSEIIFSTESSGLRRFDHESFCGPRIALSLSPGVCHPSNVRFIRTQPYPLNRFLTCSRRFRFWDWRRWDNLTAIWSYTGRRCSGSTMVRRRTNGCSQSTSCRAIIAQFLAVVCAEPS